jgi:hypothetical protein
MHQFKTPKVATWLWSRPWADANAGFQGNRIWECDGPARPYVLLKALHRLTRLDFEVEQG